MLRLSYWQWNRHLEKEVVVQKLNENLTAPPVLFSELIKDPNLLWEDMIHRRVILYGEFDFEKEMILRNRRYKATPGGLLLTPFKLTDQDGTSLSMQVLISRGFIPLKLFDIRKEVSRPLGVKRLIGLIKESQSRKVFSPKDPANNKGAFNEFWLRVNLPSMARQLPYPLLPVWIEDMGVEGELSTPQSVSESIVSSTSEKDEMLSLTSRGVAAGGSPFGHETFKKKELPIPMFTTLIPPSRHLGYVYEWIALALITLIMTFLATRKR